MIHMEANAHEAEADPNSVEIVIPASSAELGQDKTAQAKIQDIGGQDLAQMQLAQVTDAAPAQVDFRDHARPPDVIVSCSQYAQEDEHVTDEARPARSLEVALVPSHSRLLWRRGIAKAIKVAYLGLARAPGAHLDIDVRARPLDPLVEAKLNADFGGYTCVQVMDYSKGGASARMRRWTHNGDPGMPGMDDLQRFLAREHTRLRGVATNLVAPRAVADLSNAGTSGVPAALQALPRHNVHWVRVEGFSWAAVRVLALHYRLPPQLVGDLLAIDKLPALIDWVDTDDPHRSRASSAPPVSSPVGNLLLNRSQRIQPRVLTSALQRHMRVVYPLPEQAMPTRRQKCEVYLQEGCLYVSFSLIGLYSKLQTGPGTRRPDVQGPHMARASAGSLATDLTRDSMLSSMSAGSGSSSNANGDVLQRRLASREATASRRWAAAAFAQVRDAMRREQTPAGTGLPQGTPAAGVQPTLVKPSLTLARGSGRLPAFKPPWWKRAGSKVRAALVSMFQELLVLLQPSARGTKARPPPYRYQRRWVEEPVVLLLLSDTHAGGGSAAFRASPLPSSKHGSLTANGASAAANGSFIGVSSLASSQGGPDLDGVKVKSQGEGGSTLVSIFHYSGRPVSYRIWQSILHDQWAESRQYNGDYLMYALLRQCVDVGREVVRDMQTQMQEMQQRVRLGLLDTAVTEQLHVLQGEVALLQGRMHASMVLVRALARKDDTLESMQLIGRVTRERLRSLEDQLKALGEELSATASQASELSTLIFNIISHRSNASMQALSIVSVVFLPITFIAGVYGTNFEILPELAWRLGYLYFWMLCLGVSLLVLLIMLWCGMLALRPIPLPSFKFWNTKLSKRN